MRVEKQEVAMVVGIVWIFSIAAQIPSSGFWPSLLLGLPLALLAGGAYWLLMPWVIHWAAKGRSKENPSPQEGEGPDPEATDEASARR